MIAIFYQFWLLVVRWFELFVAPIFHLELLWIIVPIYLSWLAAEFFQEKLSTSLGNAISNGVVVLWVGIDWLRQITDQLIYAMNYSLVYWPLVITKMAISVLVLAYGIFIVVGGIRAKKVVRYFGRIREVTYVLLMFTPVIYGFVDPDWRTFLAIFLFSPAFYYLIELIDYYTPDPEAMDKD